ncbi:hypothetical protein BDR07DRAFT_1384288 [Suillus spraguei]|nr:hypothetical protein BDR07DRAFT_1384288 [Suillus spraguei]
MSFGIEDTQEENVTQLRSASSNLSQSTGGLLEMIDRAHNQIASLLEELSSYEAERERTRVEHNTQVERYLSRIDALEEDNEYQKALLEATSEEVERLEAERETQEKALAELLNRSRRATIERNNCI